MARNLMIDLANGIRVFGKIIDILEVILVAETIEKEVNFKEYCPICKHQNDPESEDPCDECLEYPSNTYSRKPVNFRPKKG